jgi:hypothetical protein
LKVSIVNPARLDGLFQAPYSLYFAGSCQPLLDFDALGWSFSLLMNAAPPPNLESLLYVAAYVGCFLLAAALGFVGGSILYGF